MSTTKKTKYIVTGVVVGLIIIVLSAILGKLMYEPVLEIANIDQIDTGLTDKQTGELEDLLWQNMQSIYGYGDDEKGVKVLIRPSSFEKTEKDEVTNYRFLIDVDEFKMTYAVSFGLLGKEGFYETPVVECPREDQMKYAGMKDACDRAGGNNDLGGEADG